MLKSANFKFSSTVISAAYFWIADASLTFTTPSPFTSPKIPAGSVTVVAVVGFVVVVAVVGFVVVVAVVGFVVVVVAVVGLVVVVTVVGFVVVVTVGVVGLVGSIEPEYQS